jgi:predicted NUDIX family NTP pyrophosphohydrolase
MARPISAGTLLYRRTPGANPGATEEERWQVLLVHPSGAYNRRAPWSIPKGMPAADELLEGAARRETVEETGVHAGELAELGRVSYRKSRKDVVAFAGPAPDGAAPRCASWEVDAAEFVSLARARALLHPDQAPLIDLLRARLDGTGP